MSFSSLSFGERPGNPFRLDDPCNVFGSKEADEIRVKAKREMLQNLTLKERAERMTSPIPTCHNSQTRTRVPSQIGSPTGIKTSHKHESAKRMSEFIQQKREAYLMQLIIDSKNEEIRKIYQTMSTSEKEYDETEATQTDLATKYKLISSQSENMVARQRKNTEYANSHRVELTKKLKHKQHDISAIQSEISKNEELLEQYQLYNDFLNDFKPKDRPIEYYYDDTSKLMDEIDKYEKQNLFLIDQYQNLQNQLDKDNANYAASIRDVSQAVDILESQIDRSNPLIDFQKSEQNLQNQLGTIDSEINRLSNLVRNMYLRLYREDPKLNAMHMLQKVDSDLELMYSQSEDLNRKYYNDKQAQLEKKRRDQQRIEQQKEIQRQAQEKKEAALARANRTVQKRMGKPLMYRTTLKKVVKNDDAKRRRQEAEQRRIDQLLFGEDFD
ncbi:hypothetical protein TVAG_276890 [Trichomonas vaginalis G3]|uniref:DUF4200 domain-containing protein n=1 Tax=Trichomonas vaginalis (strain ATCC PRA-98 / G3) TaxID=412133 RepID=A2FUE9_TRIV3|nr:cilia- and flagella-associated protein 100 family [Trichomonas vaginalis G3]EAX91470.1 hypothetical protein TVAG_276890 [Trichomonas vaginalis G3]KAI5502241.1 cilia- and flagella-associated protein 100 family [Trichomonas vaginalis G3]|eukprot:XP_001304400.1 hypothetical protein [Trichomonas vaginalis G3]